MANGSCAHQAIRQNGAYAALCAKYPTVPCDYSGTVPLPMTIAGEGDWPPYYNSDGTGFTNELIPLVCASAGRSCVVRVSP